jgi:anthranilate 1,2-dioxygenase ferredoxin component
MSDDRWHPIIAVADLPDAGIRKTVINGWHVLIAKTDEGLFAINDRCTHQASLLSTGRIRRGAIMCPLHGARFDVASGTCIGGTYHDLRIFEVRVTGAMIEVQVPSEAPSIEDLPMAFVSPPSQ